MNSSEDVYERDVMCSLFNNRVVCSVSSSCFHVSAFFAQM